MARTRQRPRRGPSKNPIVSGDSGTYAGPQGGAGPQAAHEGGDLDAREYGVPEPDIPGGKKHIVNPQTKVHPTAAKPERPADEHKFHGVAPHDLGQYAYPPDEEDDTRRPGKPAPEPHYSDAIPVFIEARPGDEKMIKKTFAFNIRVNAGTSAAVTRIFDRDVRRIQAKVLNEDSSADIRISAQEEELLTESAQGTGTAGAGALIWHGTNSYTNLEECQDAMYAICTGSSSALLSVLLITEVPASEN